MKGQSLRELAIENYPDLTVYIVVRSPAFLFRVTIAQLLTHDT